jgi:hypothetical protein
MADLNALIAQGVQFKAPPDPFAQYAKMQELQRGEETGQMNQMLMQEKQRGFQEMNALRGVMSRPGFDLSTPESQREVYSVAPTLAEKLISGHMGAQKTAAEVRNLGFTGQETQAKLALEKQKHLGQMYRDISSRPSDANITAHAEDVEASQLYTPEEKATVRAKAERLLAMPMADRMTMLSEQGATAGELRPQTVAAGGSLMRGGTVVGTAPEKTPPPPAMVGEYNFAKTPEGGGFRGTYQDFVTARAAAGRAPAMPRPEQPPVAVVDPVTGKQVFVSREEAVKNRMTPASAEMGLKPLTELQTIKLRTDVAKDYKTATTTLSQMDDLLESIDRVKTAPGLSAAAGYTGKLPSFPGGAAAQAETRLANLRGKVTALGKSLASATGAIGSIATQEWKVLADQVANLDETKGAGPLLEQISLIEEQTAGAIARIRDQYEKTRSEDFERFPQFRDLPAPKKLGGKPAAPTGTSGFKYLGKEGQ